MILKFSFREGVQKNSYCKSVRQRGGGGLTPCLQTSAKKIFLTTRYTPKIDAKTKNAYFLSMSGIVGWRSDMSAKGVFYAFHDRSISIFRAVYIYRQYIFIYVYISICGTFLYFVTFKWVFALAVGAKFRNFSWIFPQRFSVIWIDCVEWFSGGILITRRYSQQHKYSNIYTHRHRAVQTNYTCTRRGNWQGFRTRRLTDIQTDRHTDIQTDRHTDIQTDRHTDNRQF